MSTEFTYLNFFRDLYCNRRQKYAFSARTIKEFEQWKRVFRQEIRERFGLKTLEEIVAGTYSCPKVREKLMEKTLFKKVIL